MKRLISVLAVVVMLFGLCKSGSAAQLDEFREMLKNRHCTIKYEDVSPLNVERDKDATMKFSATGMFAGRSYVSTGERDKNTGIIVLKGDSAYIEQMNVKNYDKGLIGKRKCRIVQGRSTLAYIVDNIEGKDYYSGAFFDGLDVRSAGRGGPDSSYVYATPTFNEYVLANGMYYGDATFTEVLNAIYRDEAALAPVKQYRSGGAGSLADGVSYEDWQCVSADGEMEAIRYYFKDGQLIKIALANYAKLPNGKVRVERHVYNILEFSNNVDENYLALPSVVTLTHL